eukprot:TRINITY_DN2819_c0_g1_i1.p1 TRINITY_DN2819_c0_g1~~TRINITY_DN2819_c0_g1_i1.p1  ORF type:complete len:269 (+),score=-2.52 TRINITY_DN2819_c0_g1_i1:167-973(+)
MLEWRWKSRFFEGERSSSRDLRLELYLRRRQRRQQQFIQEHMQNGCTEFSIESCCRLRNTSLPPRHCRRISRSASPTGRFQQDEACSTGVTPSAYMPSLGLQKSSSCPDVIRSSKEHRSSYGSYTLDGSGDNFATDSRSVDRISNIAKTGRPQQRALPMPLRRRLFQKTLQVSISQEVQPVTTPTNQDEQSPEHTISKWGEMVRLFSPGNRETDSPLGVWVKTKSPDSTQMSMSSRSIGDNSSSPAQFEFEAHCLNAVPMLHSPTFRA